MRIESGPTGERKVRVLLMLVMFAGFSIWFAYDGFIGYPGGSRPGLFFNIAPRAPADKGNQRLRLRHAC